MPRALLLAVMLSACVRPVGEPLGQDAAPSSCSPAEIAIHDVQGIGHRSPFDGVAVSVCGVVTAVTNDGFFLQQDLVDDGDPRTSEALFVRSHDFAVALGDEISAGGAIREQASSSSDLPITEMVAQALRRVGTLASPAPIRLGSRGWRVPSGAVDSNPTTFEPRTDAADFYESIESMRVAVDDAVVVGASRISGEIVVLADPDRSAPRTSRGGLLAAIGDENPERIVVMPGAGVEVANADVGDRFDGRIDGVIGYGDGEYVLIATSPMPAVVRGAEPAGSSTLAGATDSITVASYNVHNLSLLDAVRLDAVAAQVVARLGSPDVIALQEIEDDDGSGTKTLSADKTLAAIVSAILENGGPEYGAFDIAPTQEDADGGSPHSNIRPAFLYRTDRIGFFPRSSSSTEANVGSTSSGALIVPNPARLAPSEPVWQGSRKPLVGQFCFNDHLMTFIDVHLRSRLGDDPLFGARQPPLSPSETARIAQTDVVASFIEGIRSAELEALVVVLGDFNDDPFSQSVTRLTQAMLTNALDGVTEANRYTYNYRGNSHAFDQVLLTPEVAAQAAADIVHTNADFAEGSRVSDHDPVVVRFSVPAGAGCP